MVANAFAGTHCIRQEDSFMDSVSEAEWEASGGEIYTFNVDLSQIKIAMADNKNMKQRPGATFAPYETLRSSVNVPYGMYAFGASSNAATGAAAVLLAVQDQIFLNWTGGQTRSYAAALTGAGTTTAPVINEGDMDSTPVHGWVFAYDDSAGVGRPVRYDTVTDGGGGMDDTLNLTTGFALLASPDAADVLHGCVTYEFQWEVMENHLNASHVTHAEFFDMQDSEDIYQVRGVKYDISEIAITAGEPVEFSVVAKCGTFDDPAELAAALAATPTFGTSPEGSPGKVVGQGVATYGYLQATGSNIYDATTYFWETIKITPGVEYERAMGPNGEQGVHGYHPSEGSYDATMVEVTVPFDNAWNTAFRAGTEYQLLVQIGDQPTDCRFFYLPRLAWADEPERVSVAGRAGMVLRFKAREPDISLSGLDAVESNRARAKFVYGRVG